MENQGRDSSLRLASTAPRQLNRRQLLWLGAGIASSSLLAACGGGADNTPGADQPAATQTAAQGPQAQIAPTAVQQQTVTTGQSDARQGGTLIVAVGEEPQSMDSYVASAPSSGMIYDNIFDELTMLEPDGTVVPRLAASWEVVEPTRWRFKLQENVTWHDGSPFTAEDVVYHFQRVFDPDKPGRPYGLTPGVDHAEAVDDTTVDVVTEVPIPTLANDLAPRWNVISSHRPSVEQWGDQYGDHPIGTGPFRFVEWKKGEEIVLEAFEDYWGGRPYLDRVIIRFIPEDTTRLLALESGEVDYIYGLPRHEVARLESSDQFKVLKSPNYVTMYLVFNASHQLLQDVRVRQALAYAIDKQEIVEVAFEGQAQVAEQLVAPGVAGYDASSETAWPYDPDQARALLSEAGWTDSDGDGILEKDGQKLSLEFSYSTGSRYPVEVSTVLQSQMREIGVDFQLREWENAALLTEYPKGQLACYAYGQGLGSGHFGQLAFNHFHSQGGRNYNFLYKIDADTTARLDEILEASVSEFDAEKRQDLWRQVMAINREQALMIPLYHPFELAATSAKVMDAYVHPGEYLRLWRVWLQE